MGGPRPLFDMPDLSTVTAPPAGRTDRSVSMAEANLYSLAFALPAAVLLVGGYVGVWGGAALTQGMDLVWDDAFVALLVLVAGVVAHEGIHGVTWQLAGRKPAGTVRYGFQWKTLTPYAHCTEPMGVRAYRLGALMPGLLLGLLPALAGLGTGHSGVMLFGLLFTLAAGGDVLVLWLIRDLPAGARVEDHPSRAGCYVYA